MQYKLTCNFRSSEAIVYLPAKLVGLFVCLSIALLVRLCQRLAATNHWKQRQPTTTAAVAAAAAATLLLLLLLWLQDRHLLGALVVAYGAPVDGVNIELRRQWEALLP